jgi:predicted kinase
MGVILLIRGLPGSGKSTLAATTGLPVFEADDYFTRGGVYNFVPAEIAAAHAACQDKARKAVEAGCSFVVSNTFSQRWEMQPYLAMATEAGVEYIIMDLFDGGKPDSALACRNIHEVPLASIQAMRARWEHKWWLGDHRPPWERG